MRMHILFKQLQKNLMNYYLIMKNIKMKKFENFIIQLEVFQEISKEL